MFVSFRWLDTVQEFMSMKHRNPVAKERAQKLMSYSLRLEFEWLREFLVSVKSPVVFCHNDLQEGNILLRLDTQDGQVRVSQPELVVIDFEFCSYNYRGFDFANHMCEWLYDYSNQNPPYFWVSPENSPSQKQQEHFMRCYSEALQADQHMHPATQEEMGQLLKELRAFTLASHFFWGLWSVCYASISTIPFDYWEYGKVRFEAYFKHKASILSTSDDSPDSNNITELLKSL